MKVSDSLVRLAQLGKRRGGMGGKVGGAKHASNALWANPDGHDGQPWGFGTLRAGTAI